MKNRTTKKRGVSVGMFYLYTFLMFIFLSVLFSCADENQTLETTIYRVEKMQNGKYKTTVYPDGNSWTTTKDSIQIYIDNY